MTAPQWASRRAATGASQQPRLADDRAVPVAGVHCHGHDHVLPLIFQTSCPSPTSPSSSSSPGPLAPWVGLDNYVDILQNNLGIPNFSFIRQVIFNIWWALANVAIHVVLGVAIALLLNVKGLRFKKVLAGLSTSCRSSSRPSSWPRSGAHVRYQERRHQPAARGHRRGSSTSRRRRSRSTGCTAPATSIPFLPGQVNTSSRSHSSRC